MEGQEISGAKQHAVSHEMGKRLDRFRNGNTETPLRVA